MGIYDALKRSAVRGVHPLSAMEEIEADTVEGRLADIAADEEVIIGGHTLSFSDRMCLVAALRTASTLK